MKLRNLWNKQHPDVKIAGRKTRDIWKSLNKNLESVCKNELCWLQQKFVKGKVGKNLREKTFAPTHPVSWNAKKSEWLDSLDISAVMKQYESEHDDFEFLGPSPIDFDVKQGKTCVWDEICECDIKKKYNAGIHKLGFIFNLDPHYKGGSHWVSMFVDLDKNYIFFMDSNGIKVPSEIKVLANRLKAQAKEGLSKKLRFIDNAPTEHQYADGQCGMYCLFVIVQLLKGKLKPQQIKRRRITDEKMQDFRSVFYNAPEP